jgi:hypothetical protein
MTKKELKKLLKDNNYQVRVVNTYTGLNWDNPESKKFVLIVGSVQLNPIVLKELGFESHFKEKYAKKGLFYSGVLGMSRAFEIVYNLSVWLYGDGYKLKLRK